MPSNHKWTQSRKPKAESRNKFEEMEMAKMEKQATENLPEPQKL